MKKISQEEQAIQLHPAIHWLKILIQVRCLQAFYAEIYKEARVATPGRGHDAIRMVEDSGKLVRHYTLNVDGLAGLAGCSTWQADSTPEGRF